MDCRWVHIIPPEKTTLEENELLQPLNVIHGWHEFIGPCETDLIEQCERACATPLGELTLPDLNTLVMQKVGLKTLLKIAIPIVELAPWFEADYYNGDLLWCLINADDEINEISFHMLQRIGDTARRLRAILKEERRIQQIPDNCDDEFGDFDLLDDIENFLSKWSFNTN